MELTFEVHDHVPAEAGRIVDQGLGDSNEAAAPVGDVARLSCFVSLASTIVGGAVGRTWGECCELQQLWVDPAHRRRGIATLVDGSQAVPHRPVDIPLLGCDFYAFTGHKMLGPTGTGGLWARREHLQAMPPFLGGGEMIREVRFDGTTFNDAPHKFEAGTPNIAGVVGLGAAVDYLSTLCMAAIEAREQELLAYALAQLDAVPGLRIVGRAAERAAVISFLVEGAHAHDLATLLDLDGVAVRSGHHCAHPLMQFYGVPATCRASIAFYNRREDIDALVAGIAKARTLLG